MSKTPSWRVAVRFRLSTLAVLLTAMAILLTATMPAAEARTRTAVTDIAHRGSSGSAPENTLAAVELALAQHASYIEVDVQRSADGELVIIHDTTLQRTTNVEEVFPGRTSYRVGDFTLEELKRLDAGSWFGEEFSGEQIPTLRELIDTIGGRAGLLLEFKAPELYPGIEAEIAAEMESIPDYLKRALASERLVVQSFNVTSMRLFHELQPEIPVGLLYGYRPSEAELVAASEWADQINPSYRVTDQALVDRVHELGMTISVYTLNTGKLMREYIALGVDGIISNYPAVLRDILHRRT
ncbi:MAG: glycerophosphodiester phosphodiesterase family protein [Solirubrobacteraceae bacterium]